MPVEGAADPGHRIVLIDRLRLATPPDLSAHDLLVHELLHLGHDEVTTTREHVAVRELSTSLLAAALTLRFVPDLALHGPGSPRAARVAYWSRSYPQAIVFPALHAAARRGGIAPERASAWVRQLHFQSSARRALDSLIARELSDVLDGPLGLFAERVSAHYGAPAECASGLHRYCGHSAVDRLFLGLGTAYAIAYETDSPVPAWASAVMAWLDPERRGPDALADALAVELTRLP